MPIPTKQFFYLNKGAEIHADIIIAFIPRAASLVMHIYAYR
jgi:hypothetical protein